MEYPSSSGLSYVLRDFDDNDGFRMVEPAEKEKRKMWHFGEEANIDSLSSWAKNEKDQGQYKSIILI